jgi:hypothetical protein
VANAVNAQLLISGSFTNKTPFTSEGIDVQVGPDVETGTRQSKISLTWDNSDLSMDPSNVLSPLYGLIGLNTQCRLQVGGTTLCTAEAVKWAPDRTLGHTVTPARGRSWTDFSAEGVLRRLGKWEDPLRSAIFRQIISYDSTKLTGYWSAEGPGTNLPNAISGGFTGKVVGTATWAGNAGAAGSDKTIQLGSDGALSASFIRSSASGWQIAVMAQIAAIPATTTYVTFFSWRTSNGVTYDLQTSNGGFQVVATRDDGTVLGSVSSLWGTGVVPSGWVRYRIRVTVSGSTVTVEMGWYPQDGTVVYGTSGTYSGTSTGTLANWYVSPASTTNGASYGHIMGTTDVALDLLTGRPVASLNGYKGERAATRYARLCDEEGIANAVLGTAASTIAMGPQKPGLFLDLLQECSVTDRAILYDDPSTIGLMFRTRSNRYGQTSKLDLTYGNGLHVQALKKVIDDVGVVNNVTVTNTTGTAVTRVLTAGPYSVQPPPNGVGRVKGTVAVNQLDDEALDDRAEFELNLLSQGRPRYQQITVDLLANPGLITACNSIRPGDLITLAGVEPDPVPLHVISYVHHVGHTERKFVMECVPGELWKTGQYDTTSAGNVYGVASTSLNALSGTTGTSLVVNVPDPLETWSLTATGYSLVIEGERVTVTGAFGAVSAGTQTATVTRSVNGVVRTHTAGAAVLVYDQARYAY